MKRILTHLTFVFSFEFTVGSRDHAPLSKDTVFASWNTDRFTWRKWHIGEVGKEQTETDHIGAGRKVGEGIESCQICRMLGIDSGKFEIEIENLAWNNWLKRNFPLFFVPPCRKAWRMFSTKQFSPPSNRQSPPRRSDVKSCRENESFLWCHFF